MGPAHNNEGYEIVIPDYVTRDIIRDYLQKTYYWSVAVGCLMIGFFVGVLVK